MEDTDTSPYYTSAPPYIDEGLHVRFKALKNFKLTVNYPMGMMVIYLIYKDYTITM